MTIQQREYATKRVSGILRQKRKEITGKHTKKAVTLDRDERRAAYVEGEYELAPKRVEHRHNRTEVIYRVEFDAERDKEVDIEAIKEEMRPLERMARRAKDEIMLGDDQRGQKMIDVFEKFAEGNAFDVTGEEADAFRELREAAEEDA